MIPRAESDVGNVQNAGTYNPPVLAIWTNRVVIALSWIGVFIAGVLTYGHFSNNVPPCSYEEGCFRVQSSPQAMFLGVPVALLGLVGYLLVLLLAVMRTKMPDQWKTTVTRGLVLTGVGTGFSAYLTYVAATQIGALCQWCMASLATMTLLFVGHGILAQAKEPEKVEAGGDWLTVGIGGLAAVAMIAVGISQMTSAGKIALGNLTLNGVDAASIVARPEQTQGNADAKVTLVEFADFNCPACRQAAVKIKAIYDSHGGRLKWSYRNMPLIGIPGHETSMLAARISEVAADQGKFWKFADIVLEPNNTERTKSDDGLMSMAKEAGLDMEDLRKRIDNPDDQANKNVAADMDVGMNTLHASMTPTIILIAEGHGPQGVTSDTLEATLNSEPYKSLLKP